MAFSYRLVRGTQIRAVPAARCGGAGAGGYRQQASWGGASRANPGTFPNGAESPIQHGPKTVQMGFFAPFGIRTFAEGGHVLGRFFDTLLSIKPLFVDYASIVRFSTYVVYLSIVEEKLERYSFSVNLMDTCRFNGGSSAEKKVHHGLFQEELLQADGCRGDNGRIRTFSHAFHRRDGADQ